MLRVEVEADGVWMSNEGGTYIQRPRTPRNKVKVASDGGLLLDLVTVVRTAICLPIIKSLRQLLRTEAPIGGE